MTKEETKARNVARRYLNSSQAHRYDIDGGYDVDGMIFLSFPKEVRLEVADLILKEIENLKKCGKMSLRR